MLCAGSCVEIRTTSPRWDKLREIADPPAHAGGDNTRGPRGGTYAIKLHTLTGRDRLKQAHAFCAALRETGQIPGIWFVSRGDETTVYAGRFRNPKSPDAKTELAQARRATFDGGKPFRRAELVAINPERSGVTGRWDLRQHRGYRSLVLEVFDVDGSSNFRRQAEQRATELREETDLDIYYFLGNYQAYVTVEIFNPNVDYITVNGVETPGPRVRELRERFPTVLYNGKPRPNPKANTKDGMEPTVVIKIP